MEDLSTPTGPTCRWCAGPALTVVLDLGEQPTADLFPLPTDAMPDPVSPLRMASCNDCGLAQLVEDAGVAEEPLGVEPRALVLQTEDAVARVGRAGLLGTGQSFAEFDSPHGGSWRELLDGAGCLDRTDADGDLDIVVDVFGFMHDANQAQALALRTERLTAGGSLLLQYHSLESIVRRRQWNALRHGHMAYYSTRWLSNAVDAVGLAARRAWRFDLYGGTVLLEATRGRHAPDPTLSELLATDDALGLISADGLAPLRDAAGAAIDELAGWLSDQRDAGRSVLGYGAVSRAVPLLAAAGVGPDLLAAVADGSPAKHGRALPGARIPIISPAELIARRPDVVLLFVPDLLTEVRAALPDVERHGGRWAVSEPRPRLVEAIPSR